LGCRFAASLPQGGIAVGRLDELLGLAAQGQALQFLDALGARRGILGQIADKGKVLAVEAAGRQASSSDTGPSAARRDAQIMGGAHDGAAGVGHGGHAG
jgi:hypothetical protein